MGHLRNPFDDGLFTALASERGVERDDLPASFEPGAEWGNDGISEDLPGMPLFSYLCGDEVWHGIMTIYFGRFGDYEYRRAHPHHAIVTVPMLLPDTVMTGAVGRPCGDLIDMPHVRHLPIRAVRPYSMDDETTEIVLALPEGW